MKEKKELRIKVVKVVERGSSKMKNPVLYLNPYLKAVQEFRLS